MSESRVVHFHARARWPVALWLACLACELAAAGSALGAATKPDEDVLFDARRTPQHRGDRPRVSRATGLARAALAHRLGKQGIVETDPLTGGVRVVARLDGFLTAPREGDPAVLALDYVRDGPDVFGLDPGDLDALRLVRRYTSPNGVTHLLWAQTYRGITALDTDLRANVTSDGRIVNMLGSPRPDLRLDSVTPALGAGEALAAAMQDAGVSLGLAPRASPAAGPDRATRFAGGHRDRLVLVTEPRGARLAWRVTLEASAAEVYDYVIDATTGGVLRRENTVRDAAQALTWDRYPGAAHGGTALPADLSPYLTSSVKLSGPNAHVFANPDGDDVIDSGEEIPPDANGDWNYAYNPVASPLGSCPAAGCAWNHQVANSWQTNVRQDATQAFWFVNRYHDHLRDSAVGFDTAGGAFEGGDRLIVRTDDGASTQSGLPDPGHRSNASMRTPPDGQSPTMLLYLWGGDGLADVNGGDDAAIVDHEYTHGLSGRLVTDAGKAAALSYSQSHAMSEGWSDWYALDFVVADGNLSDGPAGGEVVMGDFEDAERAMVRTQGLDCPVGASAVECPGRGPEGPSGTGPGGYTYDDYGKVDDGGPEPHADGEIWAEALWDLRRRMIADHGASSGVDRARSLITEGMRLSPPNPSFLDMRNAIVQADSVAGGADAAAIWAVFAARGMGYYASAVDGGDDEPVADYVAPPAAGGPTGTLRGTISDLDSGTPVAGARVYLGGHFSNLGTDLTDLTGSAGEYAIGGVPDGTYPHLVVSAVGYERLVHRDAPATGPSTTLDERLRRNWAHLGAGAGATPAPDPQSCSSARALDGSPRTAWSVQASGPATVVVRLPQTVDVSGFGVDPGAGCGNDTTSSAGSLKIETSPDGTSWTTAAEPDFGPADNHRMNDVAPEPGATSGVRDVRLTLVQPQGPVGKQHGHSWEDWMDLSEFQVYASVNDRPSAALDFSPDDPATDDPVVFSANGSSDPDGTIERYEWDLDGNGSFETDTGTGQVASHRYSEPGEVIVRVRVSDDKRATDMASRQISIQSGAEIVDLGQLSGRPYVHAGDVNRLGEVVGDADASPVPGTSPRAFRSGAGDELPSELPGPGGKSTAFSLNTAGLAVGWWDPPESDIDFRAILWSGGSGNDLGTLGGKNSIARGINPAGEIVGQAQIGFHSDETDPYHAFARVGGGMNDLGTLNPSDQNESSVAYDVNASGQVAGWSDVAGDGEHALLQSGGPLMDLGTLGGRDSEAWAVNEVGQAVGWSQTGFGTSEPFIYSNGHMRSLGSLGGAEGAARDIDNKGRVVGYSRDPSGALRAFLYRDGEMIALTRLLPKDSSWTSLTEANGINDAGQIVGYGVNADGQQRGFLLDLAGCEICVEKVTLEKRDVKTGAWEPVLRGDTVVDGNPVRATAKLTNHGTESQAMNVRFVDVETRSDLPDGKQAATLGPGQSKEVVYEWDTAGYAWHDAKPVEFRPVRVRLDLGRHVFDSRLRSVRIGPRPVVAVHGLNSTAATWSSYPEILLAAHPNWRFFAVGDGNATGESMDTGSLSRPLAIPNTVEENAEVLDRYVRRVREDWDAPQVDLLAHSMGGLISRQYVDALMPDPGAGKPVVHSLVMLGTPNRGSPCADLFPLPETYELRRDVVADFNLRVTHRRGVEMSVVAGDPLPFTCQEPAQGDGAVSVASAHGDFTDSGTQPIQHTQMTSSQALFDAWVKPHLVPGAVPARSPARAAAVGARADASADRELLRTDVVTVGPGETVDVSVAVPAASRLGVTHTAPPTMRSELIDPNGGTAGTPIAAGSPEASQPYRTLLASNPAAGTWKLRLTNTGGETASVPVTAWVEGSSLDVDVAVTSAGGGLAIVATPHAGAVPLSGASVKAVLRALNGAVKTGVLLDDGLNGDAAAGDGTYRLVTPALRSGRWLVAVTAEGTHAGAPYSRVAIATARVSFIARGGNGAIAFRRTDASGSTPDGLYSVRPDGSGEAKLPFDGEQPEFSPDGRTVAYTDGDDLWVAAADGSSSPRRVTSGPETDRDPAWSPGGGRLAFARSVGDPNAWVDGVAQGIWIKELATGAEKRLSTSRGCGRECVAPTGKTAVIDSQPTWSPEADEIAFVHFLWTGGSALYLTDVADDAEGKRPAPRELGQDYFLRRVDRPDWAPDGSRIVFGQSVPGVSHRRKAIYTIRPDGSGLRTLAEPERCRPANDGRICDVDYSDPDWSPDSALIVLVSNLNATGAAAENDAVYAMSARAGVGLAQLTSHAFDRSLPDWGTLTTESSERAPVCLDSTAEVPGDTSTALGLLCTDANGDALQRAIIAPPAHGTLESVDQAAATVRYTPAPGFRGEDALTFRASDGAKDSNVATVTITVVEPPLPPPPPTAGGGGSSSSGAGSSSSGGGSGSNGGSGGGGASSGTSAQCTPSGNVVCTVPVTCPTGAPANCDGDISNRSGVGGSRAAAARYRPLFKPARFSIRPGRTAKVRLRLTHHGRVLLKRTKRVRTYVLIRSRIGSGPYTRSVRSLVLKLSARHS